jgi:hypothetical protein
VLIGALVVVVLLVLLLLFGGIPGLSLNVSSAGSGASGTYSLSFEETGLPTGTSWTVLLLTNSSTTPGLSQGTTIAFSEPNGLYQFEVNPVGGYSANPGGGAVAVNGSDRLVPISFSPGAPLGTVFAWGVPVNATGVSTPGCPSTTGHYCYTIEIAGAGGGVTTANILLQLRNSLGANVAWPVGVAVSLFSPTNVSAVATYDTATQTWTLAPPYNGTLSGGWSLVFYTASTGAGNGFLGDQVIAKKEGIPLDQVIAIGTNGFTGTVPSAAFS